MSASTSAVVLMSREDIEKIPVDDIIKRKLTEIFKKDDRAEDLIFEFCSHVLHTFKLESGEKGKIRRFVNNNNLFDAYEEFFKLYASKSLKENRNIGPILKVLDDLEWHNVTDKILTTDWTQFGVAFSSDVPDGSMSNMEEETEFPNPANLDERFEEFPPSEILQIRDEMEDNETDQNYWDEKPLRIVVTKAASYHPPSHKVHKMTSKPRGVALIVNNDFKGTMEERMGCEIDISYMGDLFCQLGFSTFVARNVPSTGLANLMERYRKKLTSEMDASVIVVMSHGKRDKLKMADHKEIDIDAKLLVEMRNEKLQPLGTGFEGKPKIFIFQACQIIDEKEYQDWRINRKKAIRDATYSEIHMLYPSSPGNPAHRRENQGSRFIWAISEVFMKHAHEDEMAELNRKIQGKMREINENRPPGCAEQKAYYKGHDCLKELYFNPDGEANGIMQGAPSDTTPFLVKSTASHTMPTDTGTKKFAKNVKDRLICWWIVIHFCCLILLILLIQLLSNTNDEVYHDHSVPSQMVKDPSCVEDTNFLRNMNNYQIITNFTRFKPKWEATAQDFCHGSEFELLITDDQVLSTLLSQEIGCSEKIAALEISTMIAGQDIVKLLRIFCRVQKLTFIGAEVCESVDAGSLPSGGAWNNVVKTESLIVLKFEKLSNCSTLFENLDDTIYAPNLQTLEFKCVNFTQSDFNMLSTNFISLSTRFKRISCSDSNLCKNIEFNVSSSNIWSHRTDCTERF